MSTVTELLESIIGLPEAIVEVASQGPIEAVLVFLGSLLIVVPSLLLLYLVLGAGIDLVKPDSIAVTHPKE